MIKRVIPLVEKISKHVNVSIDTRNVEVAREALKSGAKMINDVSGLRDRSMMELVVESECEVCIMHMLGEPGTMQNNPQYKNVTEEVNQHLLLKARELVEMGHSMDKIHLDPGIGFGKTLEGDVCSLAALVDSSLLQATAAAGAGAPLPARTRRLAVQRRSRPRACAPGWGGTSWWKR